MKIWEKLFFGWLLSDCWIIEAKIKMKKFWKTSTISEHITLKLGYVPIFMKVQENFFWLTLDWFSTNWGKSKNEDEEIWEIFELSKSILGYAWPFMKIWEKEIWLAFHWFLTEEKWRWRWKNFRKWVLFLNSPLET